MHPSNCPLCGSPVRPESYSGGSYVVRCDHCGGAWEIHNSLVRRISDPDWSKVDAARTAPDREAAESPQHERATNAASPRRRLRFSRR